MGAFVVFMGCGSSVQTEQEQVQVEQDLQQAAGRQKVPTLNTAVLPGFHKKSGSKTARRSKSTSQTTRSKSGSQTTRQRRQSTFERFESAARASAEQRQTSGSASTDSPWMAVIRAHEEASQARLAELRQEKKATQQNVEELQKSVTKARHRSSMCLSEVASAKFVASRRRMSAAALSAAALRVKSQDCRGAEQRTEQLHSAAKDQNVLEKRHGHQKPSTKWDRVRATSLYQTAASPSKPDRRQSGSTKWDRVRDSSLSKPDRLR